MAAPNDLNDEKQVCGAGVGRDLPVRAIAFVAIQMNARKLDKDKLPTMPTNARFAGQRY